MRCGLGQFMHPTPEFLKFAQQYGVTDMLLHLAHDKIRFMNLVKDRSSDYLG